MGTNNRIEAWQWFWIWAILGAFIFYVFIPLLGLQKPGNPFRLIYFIYTNIGLTYYEFFSFFYIIGLLWYAWRIVKVYG